MPHPVGCPQTNLSLKGCGQVRSILLLYHTFSQYLEDPSSGARGDKILSQRLPQKQSFSLSPLPPKYSSCWNRPFRQLAFDPEQILTLTKRQYRKSSPRYPGCPRHSHSSEARRHSKVMVTVLYNCPLCQFSTGSVYAMIDHLNTHRQYAFKCRWCSMRSDMKTTITRYNANGLATKHIDHLCVGRAFSNVDGHVSWSTGAYFLVCMDDTQSIQRCGMYEVE